MSGVIWPEFVQGLPEATVPTVGLDARVVDDGRCQVALFTFSEDASVPQHTHGDKWGTLVSGQMTLTVDDTSKAIVAGESYFVPAGVPHGAQVTAGSRIIEIFAERRFDVDKR